MSVVARRVRMAQRTTTATFNPMTQVTPLHVFWAGDSRNSQSDGSQVLTNLYDNISGQSLVPTGTGPTWRTSVSGLNNRPAVEFNGTDDCLTFDITDVAQTFKLLAVFKFLTTPSTTRGVIGTGGGTLQGFYASSAPNYRINTGTILSGGTPDTSGHVARVTFNSTSSQLWIEGSSVMSGDASTGSMTRWKLGCLGSNATNASFGNVQIAFSGIYAGTTLDTDLAQLASDLKTHYGL